MTVAADCLAVNEIRGLSVRCRRTEGSHFHENGAFVLPLAVLLTGLSLLLRRLCGLKARIEGAGFRMYYAGYSNPNRADILSAFSQDGLQWEKEAEPVIPPR